MVTYKNGNCTVSIDTETGTKVREFDSPPEPVYPESIDLKITNFCDLNCPYCHEKSTVHGEDADLDSMFSLLEPLPAGAEISIGGGNALSHPKLTDFLVKLRTKGLISNITVNALHLDSYKRHIQHLQKTTLIHGLGISYNKRVDLTPFITPNVVIHLVLGVHTVDDLIELTNKHANLKVLLLGYKNKGRGILHKLTNQDAIEDNIYQWYTNIFKFFKLDGLTLSFDNLALDQLDINRFFEEDEWNKFFMGDDGQFTMYIDGVNNEFAVSSTSLERHKIEPTSTIQSIFSKVRYGT